MVKASIMYVFYAWFILQLFSQFMIHEVQKQLKKSHYIRDIYKYIIIMSDKKTIRSSVENQEVFNLTHSEANFTVYWCTGHGLWILPHISCSGVALGGDLGFFLTKRMITMGHNSRDVNYHWLWRISNPILKVAPLLSAQARQLKIFCGSWKAQLETNNPPHPLPWISLLRQLML